MVAIGKINQLRVKRIDGGRLYLDAGSLGEALLLERLSTAAAGDKLDVFVYHDMDDTLIATATKPKVLAGECAALRVVNVTKHGAYLSWGLESDLFVPRSHQLGDMSIGSVCVAMAMVDSESQRMIATTKLYQHLADQSDGRYKSGQRVELLVCQQTDMGYKAVVNGTHLGVLYNNEIFKEIRIGDQCAGFIKAIRDDGKIDLSLQKSAPDTRDALSIKIIEYLESHNGESDLTDKSAPDAIYKTFGVSKKAYKNAIGGLYRERKIHLNKERISLVDKAGEK